MSDWADDLASIGMNVGKRIYEYSIPDGSPWSNRKSFDENPFTREREFLDRYKSLQCTHHLSQLALLRFLSERHLGKGT